MKILLIGPQPPPHGGISVHVAGIERQLTAAGVRCQILDITKISNRLGFAMTLAGFAARGWTLHLHTNGHNRNSWILAWLCGLAGRIGRGSALTLHSGMAPQYVSSAVRGRRSFLAVTCRLHQRIICVAPEIKDAVVSLGMPEDRIEITPAFLAPERKSAAIDARFHAWMEQHRPRLSTALFFRPEYGFDLLIDAMLRLRERHPEAGCVVMGSGEEFQKARERVAKAGLDRHILLAGDVDHDTCLALMSASDVFVRPTLEDGDSISVREALALEVPVVASQVGTRPPGAILFHPGDVEDLLSKLEFALAHRRQAA
jgi:glycosyltransferase involved in cell wall biosynthesis